MTAKHYDRLSRWYDLLASPWEAKPKRIGLEMLTLRAGERVLEIGCGTGQTLLELGLRVGRPGRAIGVDLSAGMCRVAQSRLNRHREGKPAAVVRGDGLRLPFVERSLDAAFISHTLELFDDAGMADVLAECRRVLVAGGRLCVVAMAQTRRRSCMSRFYEWCYQRWPGIVDCRPIEAHHSLERAGFSVSDRRMLSLAGLPVEVVLGAIPTHPVL